MQIAHILIASVAILMVAYTMAVSSKDLIRLLISLEMMFGAVFLALIPLFSIESLLDESFILAIITIFTSSSELLVLIASIIKIDRLRKDIMVSTIKAGGDA